MKLELTLLPSLLLPSALSITPHCHSYKSDESYPYECAMEFSITWKLSIKYFSSILEIYRYIFEIINKLWKLSIDFGKLSICLENYLIISKSYQ